VPADTAFTSQYDIATCDITLCVLHHGTGSHASCSSSLASIVLLRLLAPSTPAQHALADVSGRNPPSERGITWLPAGLAQEYAYTDTDGDGEISAEEMQVRHVCWCDLPGAAARQA
jgi:hypothetical protein